jgi:hypothetical protein
MRKIFAAQKFYNEEPIDNLLSAPWFWQDHKDHWFFWTDKKTYHYF